MMSQHRLHLFALPLAALGLGVGLLLIWFDPVTIARRRPTGSLARARPIVTTPPEPLAVEFDAEELNRVRSLGPLPRIPPDPTNAFQEDELASRFGRSLFFEPRLSITGTISCATCHNPKAAFADARPVAEGTDVGTRNTPTLIDTAHHRWFTWDGRADSLWSQALHPIEGDGEMGGDRVAAVRLIQFDPDLRLRYEEVFGPLPNPDPQRVPENARPIPHDPEHPRNVAWLAMSEADRDRVNRVFANLGKALAAYQRELSGGPTPVDRFIVGLNDAGTMTTAPLSSAEQRGLKLFVGKANCWECHSGPLLSDEEFHDIGVPPREGGLPRDEGRYAGIELLKANEFRASGAYSDDPEGVKAMLTEGLVNSPEQWGRFKTPSLRGVAETAPYMHAGQYATLEEVIEHYSTLKDAVQLDHHRESVLAPLDLTPEEIADLAAFLRALSGPGPLEDLGRP